MVRPHLGDAALDAAALNEAAYGRWAPVYDFLFDLPFHPGRRAAANAAALSQMWRVTKPGGQMIVMNHFADEMKSPRAAGLGTTLMT